MSAPPHPPLWRRIAFGRAGLRSGWRVLAFGLLAALTMIAWTFGVMVFFAERLSEAPRSWLIVGSGSYCFPVLLASWACSRWVDGRRLDGIGLGGGWRRALGEFWAGAVGGVGLIALALGVVAIFGDVTLAWNLPAPGPFLFWAGAFLVAATWEELLFRGYGFQWLSRGMGRVGATLLLSVGFSLAHLSNPNVTLIGAVSIALAGVLLSLALFATSRLWAAIGLHWGWNVAQAQLFGVPVSGLEDREGVVPVVARATLDGPQWLTGGAFGFEGSLAAVLVLGVGIAALVPLARRRGPLAWPPARAAGRDHGEDATPGSGDDPDASP